MKTVTIRFEAATRMRTLEVMVACSPLARPPLRAGQGMLIRPCGMIHTLGMRYPIDVVFMRRDGLVLRVCAGVAPRRLRSRFGAWCVLELAAGQAQCCAIVPGLTLPLGAL